MNLRKMHENLKKSWQQKGQEYQRELGSCALSSCVLVRQALHNIVVADLDMAWSKIIQADAHKPILIDYINRIANTNPDYARLFHHGLNSIAIINSFSDNEISQILAYANNINNKDIEQLLNVVEDLNSLLGNESDNIIKQLITQDTSIKITTFGFHILTYLQNNRKIHFTSFHLDNYRWREAMLSKIILGRKHDSVYLTNLADELHAKPRSQDYCLLSANRPTDHNYADILQNLADQLSNEISCQLNTLSTSELMTQIPNSDLYYAHILQALKLVKLSGKVFLTIRYATWQMSKLNNLRQYLISNSLIEKIVFIKTSRKDPWILICLSHDTINRDQIYMLSEDFYTSGGLKYSLNNLTTSRIVRALTDCVQIKHACAWVRKETIIALNYNLDPNVCLNMGESFTRPISLATTRRSEALALTKLCSKIFRGPGLYNKEISERPSAPNYFMLGHTALTENGLASNNLTPIPQILYQQNEANYAVYPGDIVMLSRATTNRVVLIPKGNAYYLANLNILVLRPDQNIIDPNYLFLLLNSPNGRSLISSLEKGTMLKSISIKELKELKLDVLDMPAQKALVEQYNKEMNELQSAQDKFKTFMASLHQQL